MIKAHQATVLGIKLDMKVGTKDERVATRCHYCTSKSRPIRPEAVVETPRNNAKTNSETEQRNYRFN